jgi:hypothetical protein
MGECEAMRDKSDLSVVIDRLRDELLSLSKQRDQAGERIGVLKRTITGLITVFGDDVVDNELLSALGCQESPRRPGLTKQCRLVLLDAQTPLTARELCERVRLSGLLESHHNPLASVGAVLNRLVEYGEVKAIVDGGPRRYQWIA